MRLHPFRAVRPASDLAERVAAVPYDVVSRAEAVALAEGNPYSFLHVGRSDIDLPADVNPYDARIYAKARETLDRFQAEGTLLREATPSLYLYRQIMDGRAQTGSLRHQRGDLLNIGVAELTAAVQTMVILPRAPRTKCDPASHRMDASAT